MNNTKKDEEFDFLENMEQEHSFTRTEHDDFLLEQLLEQLIEEFEKESQITELLNV
jgi:hypothetical protein